MYGCETWSLTLRTECGSRVFENRFLSKIFGPKRDEVTWEWRILRNEEFFYLFSSPNIIRVNKSIIMRWVGHVACIRDGRVVYRSLWWGNLIGKGHLEGLGLDGRIILK